MKRVLAVLLVLATVLSAFGINGFALNPDSGIPTQSGITSSSYFSA